MIYCISLDTTHIFRHRSQYVTVVIFQHKPPVDVLGVYVYLPLEDAMGLGRRAKPVEMSRILQGTPIPANDVWIAATAAQHGLRLLTLDAHFLRIPQVIVDFFGPVPPAQ